MQTYDIAFLMTIIGALVLTTNVITEVLKNVFKRIPAQITATVIALVLTAATGLAYANIKGIGVEWYMAAGDIVLGFFVSYGAQFGFDKLKEIIGKFRG